MTDLRDRMDAQFYRYTPKQLNAHPSNILQIHLNAQVSDPVRTYIWGQIWHPVGNQVWDQALNHVWNQARTDIGKEY